MILEAKHKKFFELAKKISKKSNHPRHWIGCVVVKNRKIIGFGYNKIRTHTRATNKFKMLHAELDSIIGLLPADLMGATVYVYREHKDGTPALAKPCSCCHKMLLECGVRNIYFTTEGGYSI